jgi:hypothetical protein
MQFGREALGKTPKRKERDKSVTLKNYFLGSKL